MVQIINYHSFNNSIKNTNIKNFLVSDLYKKAGYKNNNNNHYGLVLSYNLNNKLIDIYGKFEDKKTNNFVLKGINDLVFYGNLIICKYNDLQKEELEDITFEELDTIDWVKENIIFNANDFKEKQKNNQKPKDLQNIILEETTPKCSTPVTPASHDKKDNWDENELTYEPFI